MFPKLDPKQLHVANDVDLVLDILEQEKLLVVQGSAFNIDDTQHLRLVFLPREDEISQAMGGIARVLENYRLRQ